MTNINSSFKYNMLLLSAISLCGCGGGSDSDTSSNSNYQKNNTDTVTETLVETNIQATNVNLEDLVTSETFLLDSKRNVALSIDISELYNSRAYLNICHTKKDGNLDYQNCLIRGPLKDGKHKGEIELGNEVEHLAMEIWTYETSEEPITSNWHNTNDNKWTVTSL